jgi:hypothetical protein
MFQRYANPLDLINKMLLMGRFREFVDEFISIHNEEQEDKTLWEFYLHRVYDQSFKDFRDSLATPKQSDVPSEEDLKKTISGSIGILTDFNPYEGRDSHGTLQTSWDNSD